MGVSFDVVRSINILSTWPQVDKLFINLGLLWQYGLLLLEFNIGKLIVSKYIAELINN